MPEYTPGLSREESIKYPQEGTNTTPSKASPRPWRVEHSIEIRVGESGLVALVYSGREEADNLLAHLNLGGSAANAEFIVRAANNFDDMLAALQVADQFFQENDDFTEGGEFPIPEFIQNIRNAISRATGQEDNDAQ